MIDCGIKKMVETRKILVISGVLKVSTIIGMVGTGFLQMCENNTFQGHLTSLFTSGSSEISIAQECY